MTSTGHRLVVRGLLRRGGLLLCLLLGPGAAIAYAAVDELAVQAAYVINFIRYTNWPEPTGGADQPYLLVVIGDRESADALRRAAMDAGLVHDRAVVVRHLAVAPRLTAQARERIAEQLADAHAVFVGRSHQRLARAVINATTGRPVLTIGVEADFARKGGMLSLVPSDGRVLFTANEQAVMSSPIVVSTKVLKLARPLSIEPE